ncbi:4-hydroxyproline epimerase [Rubrivivax rivuli]|uniref:4-hydroxyproline epimerase n=1 Tax=Rubrivivax rivuli TaxID=1862385 RepID=A0A437RQU3_9BURK|nr:4-hydroxyproline epimerase [Rubrivivax rivuli]RVU49157.1 4-hydroxyproline epimerase [Rubrivivax rivuli]
MQVPTTRIVDSHTGGEPTRLVLTGGPELGTGSLAELRERFRTQHDPWRRALMNEPRGSDVLVGALLTPPQAPGSLCGVIFFNNVGYLGMCGHGTIGVVATLAHLGRIQPGVHAIDTPVGTVQATLHDDRSVTVANVPAYRHAQAVAVDVPGLGRVHGDVAWGGNWFFLCADHGLDLSASQVAPLTAHAEALRQALVAAGITGADGAEIDHIELMGPPQDARHHGRNFVLCPGMAYDRSPCGTGTSAKLACLAADGELQPGQVWHQESVIGSVFNAHYQPAAEPGRVLPFIHGTAYVTLDATLVFDPQDPFAWGINAAPNGTPA